VFLCPNAAVFGWHRHQAAEVVRVGDNLMSTLIGNIGIACTITIEKDWMYWQIINSTGNKGSGTMRLFEHMIGRHSQCLV